MEKIMEKNLNKIKEFEDLNLNWNGYGADPFMHELLGKVDKIIKNIIVQPKVFPTGRQSIQFEYEKKSGAYLELEVFTDRIEVFSIDEDGLEKEYNIDECEINKVVSALNLFPGARSFTRDEARKYNNSLLKLFKPTGRKLFIS